MSGSRWCKAAKDVGFTLKEVRDLMSGLGRGDRGTAQLKKLADHKLPDAERALERAELMVRLLRGASQCRCPSLDRCFQIIRKRGLAD